MHAARRMVGDFGFDGLRDKTATHHLFPERIRTRCTPLGAWSASQPYIFAASAGPRTPSSIRGSFFIHHCTMRVTLVTTGAMPGFELVAVTVMV